MRFKKRSYVDLKKKKKRGKGKTFSTRISLKIRGGNTDLRVISLHLRPALTAAAPGSGGIRPNRWAFFCKSRISSSKMSCCSYRILKRGHVLHNGSDPETTASPPSFSSHSRSFGILKKMKPDMPCAANLKDQECKLLFAQHLKKHKGIGLGTPHSDMTTERRRINLSRESGVTKDRRSPASNQRYSRNEFPKDSTISPVVGSNIRSEPVMQPIWRGSFNISNHEGHMLEEVMAHMSILVCQKVNNEACQFKPVLQLEMLPMSHVWPKSFEDSESSVEKIVLYFFPSERSERFYDDLVDEMMEEELALKAIVKNAELLVFPSTKLPLSHWRFQGKYYLQGVFKRGIVGFGRPIG